MQQVNPCKSDRTTEYKILKYHYQSVSTKAAGLAVVREFEDASLDVACTDSVAYCSGTSYQSRSPPGRLPSCSRSPPVVAVASLSIVHCCSRICSQKTAVVEAGEAVVAAAAVVEVVADRFRVLLRDKINQRLTKGSKSSLCL